MYTVIFFIRFCSFAIRESKQKFDENDLEQAISFLHDSGILLHFEDSSLLNNLYFISPQWLCSMLARLITIKESNPYQRNGQCVCCVGVYVLLCPKIYSQSMDVCSVILKVNYVLMWFYCMESYTDMFLLQEMLFCHVFALGNVTLMYFLLQGMLY